MNRRSWLKSALATITLAISDGLPKILADDNKVKLKNLHPVFNCTNTGYVYCPYIPVYGLPIDASTRVK